MAIGVRRPHRRQRMLGAEEAAGDIDVHLPVPLFQRHIGNQAGGADAGVVHENVEPAIEIHDALDEFGPARLLGHVLAAECRLAAGGFDQLHRLAAAFGIDIGDEDDGAFGRQLDGASASDAAGGAGDKGHAPCECAHDHLSP